MTQINWGILQPVDIGGAFTQGMEQGQKRRAQVETRNALKAYAANPDDPQVVANVFQYNPELGLKIQESQAKRAKSQLEMRQADIQRRAAGGDRAAVAELAGIDINAWDKLNDNERQASVRRAEVLGNAAQFADTPEKWDATIDQLTQQGFPELAQYRGKFSPEARAAAISSAGKALEFMKFQRPDQIPITAGGTLYEVPPAQMGNFWSAQPAGGAPAQGGSAMTADQAGQTLQQAKQAGAMDGGQYQTMSQAFGPNGQAAFQKWLMDNRVGVRGSNGQVAYLVNGKWYDNPEGR